MPCLPADTHRRFFADYRSPLEATAVKRLREAGAILIGKTNMDEFGMGCALSDKRRAGIPPCADLLFAE